MLPRQENISSFEVGFETAVELSDHSRFLDWTDLELLRKSLEYQQYQPLEFVENKTLASSVSLASFGDTLNGPEELQSAIDNHLHHLSEHFHKAPTGTSLVGKTGFNISYWGRPMPYEASLPLQVALGTTMAADILRRSNLNPKDLRSFSIATSSPVSLMLAKYIARNLGLLPSCRVRLYSSACFSQAMAFHDIVDQFHDDHDHQSLIVSLETILAAREPNLSTPGLSDVTSLSMFSDKISGLIFRPSSFLPVSNNFLEMPDTEAALAARFIIPLKQFQNHNESLIYQNHLATIVKLPSPPVDQTLFMKPLPTTRFFLNYLKELINHQFVDQSLLPSVDYAMAHHPSILIHAKVRELLEKQGLPAGLLPWSSHYGNAPVCIFAHEYARVLPYLTPGKRLLNLFFGAGASGALRIYDVV